MIGQIVEILVELIRRKSKGIKAKDVESERKTAVDLVRVVLVGLKGMQHNGMTSLW